MNQIELEAQELGVVACVRPLIREDKFPTVLKYADRALSRAGAASASVWHEWMNVEGCEWNNAIHRHVFSYGLAPYTCAPSVEEMPA